MEIATAFGLAMTGPGARRFRIADCRFAIDGDCHGPILFLYDLPEVREVLRQKLYCSIGAGLNI